MTEVISKIDEEIAKLQQARSLLAGAGSSTQPKSGRGRPKGSKNAAPTAASTAAQAGTKQKKRQLSPEGRKAIADAMKKRWAERRKTAGGK